jgi:PAS domain S-box-containing protein
MRLPHELDSSPSGCKHPVELPAHPPIDGRPTTLEAALRALGDTRAFLDERNLELRAANERVDRLSAILRAIRNVNRCITQETDRDRMIRLACENLTETMGYLSAWIVAMEPHGKKVLSIASSGFGNQFKFLVRQVRLGVMPRCVSATMGLDEALLVEDPSFECGACPLAQCYEARSSLSHALRYEGEVYGLLIVSVPKQFASDPEELDLFRQVSRDLGFALHKIHAAKKSTENAEDLRRAQQIAGIGTWRLSRETNRFSASEEAKRIYGFSGDEWTREEAGSVVVPSYRDAIERALDAVVPQGGARELVYEINRLPDGSRRVIHSISEFDEASNTVVGTIQDITDLRQLEMEKLTQERYLRTILQTTADGFFVLDRQGTMIEVNDAFCRMQGARREMLLGRSIGSFDAVEAPEETRERIGRIMANGYETFTSRHRRIDGSEFPVEVTSTWVNDMGGQFVCFCRDITKRIRLDQRVRSLSEIMNTAPTAIYVLDLTGRFLWVNQAAPIAHGYDDVQEFLKLRVQDLDDPQSAALLESRIQDVLALGGACFEVRHQRKDGSNYPAQVVAKRIDWEGEPAILSIATNISDRVGAEEALRESERGLRSVFRSAPVGIGVVVDRVFTKVNDRLEEITGYHRSELLVRNARMLYLTEDEYLRVGREKYAQIAASHTGTVETQWLRKDGRVIEVLLSSTPLDLEDYSKGITFTALDITERKRAQEELAHSHELMRYIIEHANSAVAVMDRNLCFTYVSQQFIDAYKIPNANIIGKHHYEVFPELPDQIREVHQRVLNGEVLKSDRGQYQRADGKLEWGRWECRPWFLHDGTIGGIVLYTEFISDRVAAEEALRESNERFRTLVESAPMAVFLVQQGRCIYGNPAAATMLGCPNQEQIAGLVLADAVAEEFRDALGVRASHHIQGGNGRPMDLQFVRIGGGSVWAQAMSVTIRYEGRPTALVVAQDITTRKNLEETLMGTLEELREKKEMAESANRAKDEFLAVMSHEMRTPLNAIMGFASLMQADNPPEEWQSFLETILDAGERQLQLIDNVLNYAQLDRGSLKPNPETLRLRKICQDALRSVITVAHGLELRLESGIAGMEEVPDSLEVRADRNMLTRLLLNLLGNACKYTKKGSVTLAVGMRGDGEGIPQFRFEVRDTGIGISEEQMNRLFLPFSQVDSSLTRKFEGAGLGLAICNKLVHILGGSIGYDSVLGQGSLFWFSLPLELVAPQPSSLWRADVLSPCPSFITRCMSLSWRTDRTMCTFAKPSSGTLERLLRSRSGVGMP